MYEYPIVPSPEKIRKKRVTCKSKGITSQWPTHSANDKILTLKTMRNLPQKPQCNVDKLKAIVNRISKEPDGDKSYSIHIGFLVRETCIF